MATFQTDAGTRETTRRETRPEVVYEERRGWLVDWSAVWVGTLAAVALIGLLGLIGVAVGAHTLGPDQRVVDLKSIHIATLAFGIFAAFLAFVVGGWIAGAVAGLRRSESAMLHGAIVWLVSVPALLLFAALGAGGYSASWHAGLAGTPAWSSRAATPIERPEAPPPTASSQERQAFEAEWAEYRQSAQRWRAETPAATRNAALLSLTALLLGLMGSVIGGWIASGEPMTLTYHRHRPLTAARS